MTEAVALGLVVRDAGVVDTVVNEFRRLLPWLDRTESSTDDICIVLRSDQGSPNPISIDDSALSYVAHRLGEKLKQIVLFDHGSPVSDGSSVVRPLSFMEWLRERGEPNLARSSDLWHHYVVARLRSVVGGESELFDGRVAVLHQLDSTGRSNYVASLGALLDHGGDVAAAADSMFLHANTLRYRLRRISEITGLDLGDPVDRFVAELQIRLHFSRLL